jgi:hypothetical protein
MSWWDEAEAEAAEQVPNGLQKLDTRSSVENQVMAKINDEWSNRTAINWSSMNVPFDPSDKRTQYQDNETILFPQLNHISSRSVEYPITESAIVSDYQLRLNLLTVPNSGMGHVQEHVEHLRNLFELKSFSFGEADLDFEILEARTGFLSSTGDHWETPVSVLFTAIQ